MIESGTKYLDPSSRNSPDGLIYAISDALNPEDVDEDKWTNDDGDDIEVSDKGYRIPRNLDLQCR